MDTDKMCSYCGNFFSAWDDDCVFIEGVPFHEMCIAEIEEKHVQSNLELEAMPI